MGVGTRKGYVCMSSPGLPSIGNVGHIMPWYNEDTCVSPAAGSGVRVTLAAIRAHEPSSAARLALGHNAHPKGMMLCPMPVFWGGCVALRTDRKRAATPKWASSWAGTPGIPRVPSLVAGWVMEESHIMHGETSWHPGMSLSCGMEEPILFWHSPLPSRDSRARLEMGTAGPAVTTGAARGCHWHKAVPVWGQTHARKPPIGAGGHNWATRPCRAQEEGLRGQLLNFCGDL